MTKKKYRYALTVLAPVAMLAGCASDPARYPSLAIRDFERVEGQFEVAGLGAALPPPAAPGPATTVRMGELLDQAEAAHAAFNRELGEAQSLLAAARGMGPEDNTWARSQIALAGLDSRRAQLASHLADLDLLLADASLSYLQLDEIAAARAQVESLVAQEDQILGNLISGSK